MGQRNVVRSLTCVKNSMSHRLYFTAVPEAELKPHFDSGSALILLIPKLTVIIL